MSGLHGACSSPNQRAAAPPLASPALGEGKKTYSHPRVWEKQGCSRGTPEAARRAGSGPCHCRCCFTQPGAVLDTDGVLLLLKDVFGLRLGHPQMLYLCSWQRNSTTLSVICGIAL